MFGFKWCNSVVETRPRANPYQRNPWKELGKEKEEEEEEELKTAPPKKPGMNLRLHKIRKRRGSRKGGTVKEERKQVRREMKKRKK